MYNDSGLTTIDCSIPTYPGIFLWGKNVYYHGGSFEFHFISYRIVSYCIESYRIVSYHIVSYCIYCIVSYPIPTATALNPRTRLVPEGRKLHKLILLIITRTFKAKNWLSCSSRFLKLSSSAYLYLGGLSESQSHFTRQIQSQ